MSNINFTVGILINVLFNFNYYYCYDLSHTYGTCEQIKLPGQFYGIFNSFILKYENVIIYSIWFRTFRD